MNQIPQSLSTAGTRNARRPATATTINNCDSTFAVGLGRAVRAEEYARILLSQSYMRMVKQSTAFSQRVRRIAIASTATANNSLVS
ncbi:hypothetical protein GCK32_017829 [Trichostrongylus colubriformis]|uniref:Uncharacterized protein n=1 Tax=Trichostrongylus colubriformis TaxID=6319 RepID=A0AAN8IBV1_TRICO